MLGGLMMGVGATAHPINAALKVMGGSADQSDEEIVAMVATATREQVVEMIQKDVTIIKYLPEEFKSDKELMLGAIKETPRAMKYVSKTLLNDKDFLIEATKENRALVYVPKEIRNNKELMTSVIEAVPANLIYCEELKEDKEFVLGLVKKDGMTIRFVSESLQDDKDVVLEAVNQNCYAAEHASPRIRKQLSQLNQADLNADIRDMLSMFRNNEKTVQEINVDDGIKEIHKLAKERKKIKI